MNQLAKALKEGKAIIAAASTAVDVNVEVPSELDNTISKMSGDDTTKVGIMSAEEAKVFINSLPIVAVMSGKAWSGKVGIKVDNDGNLTITRNEDGLFDASCPDRIIKNLINKAFTEGRGIKKWDVYLPEVNEKLAKGDKALSNVALKRALTDLAKAGDIEVLLNARYGKGFASPNLIISNKGSGKRGGSDELGADDFAY